MKKIRFFPTLHDYRVFIYDEVVRTSEFRSHPFYQGLISFVIDQRAPFFFESSHDHEYAHFSQYFNFVLMRGGYPNDSLSDMFFMHDFVHMVFDNPLQPHRLSFDQFSEIANFNEYVASNETEVLTYYRMDGFRKKSFSYPILYDLLIQRSPVQPAVRELFDLRRAIVLDGHDGGFAHDPAAERIFAFLRKFKKNNQVWCRAWYDHFPLIPFNYAHKRACLPIMGYEQILRNYKEQGTEQSYRDNVLHNLHVAFAMAGREEYPRSFEECEEAVKQLEGTVIMDDAARIFHTQYLLSKTV